MNNDPDLVFVTGAGSGIGRATALRYGKLGATVVTTDINADTAEQTARVIREGGSSAYAYQLDVSDASAYEALAERVRAEHGVPDVVVNNAGFAMGGTFLDHSHADWKRTLDIHLMGVVHGCRLFGAQQVERGRGGHIVNLSSIGGIVPFVVGPAYCTAKAAIKSLSECLRVELAPHDIGVTAICPGLINTNIGRDIELVGVDDGLRGRLAEVTEVGMPALGGSPDKVADAIVRAVRHNRAVVPVRPEAWAGAALMRLSPGAVRLAMRAATRPNLERLERAVPKGVLARLTPTTRGRS